MISIMKNIMRGTKEEESLTLLASKMKEGWGLGFQSSKKKRRGHLRSSSTVRESQEKWGEKGKKRGKKGLRLRKYQNTLFSRPGKSLIRVCFTSTRLWFSRVIAIISLLQQGNYRHHSQNTVVYSKTSIYLGRTPGCELHRLFDFFQWSKNTIHYYYSHIWSYIRVHNRPNGSQVRLCRLLCECITSVRLHNPYKCKNDPLLNV